MRATTKRRVSKRQAFQKLDIERKLPIDRREHEFTRSWFVHRNLTTFSTFLEPRFPPGKPWRMVQIGVFEGMDLVWQLQNILTHPDCRALAIDPWLATTKLNADHMQRVEGRARRNLERYGSRVEIVKGLSQDILRERTPELRETLDYVIIDGDHNAAPVFQDAILSYWLVKPGGWLVFDDVENRTPKKDHVKHGVDRWLDSGYEEKVRQVWKHRFCECYERLA